MGRTNIEQVFADRTLMLNAIRRAAREAVLMHKQLGNPIADWRDGKVVIVPPEEIVVPPEIPDEPPAGDADEPK